MITNLVKDIEALLNKEEHTITEENLEDFATQIKEVFKNKFKGSRKRRLSLSQLGKPNRQLWFEVNGAPKEDIPPSAKLKFLFGDILEAMLLFLAKEAGHKVTHFQEEVEVEGIKGHLDALIDDTLIDVKSASVFGFKKFKEGKIIQQPEHSFVPVYDDPFGYVMQIAAYNHTVKTPKIGWLAVEKEKGHLALPLYDAAVLPDPVARAKEVKEVVLQPTPPARCYDPVPEGTSGNLALSMPCSYCGFKQHCWQDANDGKGIRTFLYSTGPKFLVKIVREPNVQEIQTKETTQE